jgi:hypothetical protein
MPPKKHIIEYSKPCKEYKINTLITKETWFNSQNRQGIFPAAKDLNWLWSLPGLLFNVYQRLFPQW